MVKVNINGKDLLAEKGETILQLARRHGIDIPSLCHHPALAPFGACRLCVVEIRKGEQIKIDASCTYPAEEGIAVLTDTPAVRQVRKFVLESLLLRCPDLELLRKLGMEMNLAESSLPVKGDETEKCILCGLCVRVCREVIGKNAISFVYRGAERKVATPFFFHSEDCIGCTACEFVCPTGAIKAEKHKAGLNLSPWNTELVLAECSICGSSFAPLKTIEHLKENFELPEGWENTCPDCRKKEMVKALAQ
jgi:bidirectional [NiFe] hydrogenase diaphorase subunit